MFLLENVKQLTHNSYLEANLVPFCPTFSKRYVVTSVEYLAKAECKLKDVVNWVSFSSVGGYFWETVERCTFRVIYSLHYFRAMSIRLM